MAKTRRSSSGSPSPKGSQHLQILFREYWKPLKSGGKVLEYVVDRSGENLLEKVNLEDIKPNEQYYMQGVYKPNEFTPTTFDPKVEWRTIQEIHNTGRIWRLTQERKDTVTS